MLFDRFVQGPLMEEAPAPGGGAAPVEVPAGFDATAFAASIKTDLMAEIRKDLNGGLKALKTDFAKMFNDNKPAAPVAPIVPAAEAPAVPAVPGGEAGLVAGLTAQLQKLKVDSETRIRGLEETNLATAAKAEEADRHSRIRSKLSGFTFVNDALKDAAFKLFSLDIKRDAANDLVAGDLSFDQYIDAQMASQYSHLLAPKDVGGAGARPGGARAATKVEFVMSDLTPEKIAAMKPEDRARLNQQIANLAKTAL